MSTLRAEELQSREEKIEGWPVRITSYRVGNQYRSTVDNIDPGATSFFLSRRVLRPTSRSQMPMWQEKLFIWLARSSEDAAAYFQIPSDRVVEIGTQITI